jgi:hypothetical protein
VTVLDWSTALLAPRAYDVAYTSLLLSYPPLRVPGWERPVIRMVGLILAGRFVKNYRRWTAAKVTASELRWHQAVVCLRALVEVAGWVHQGVIDTHAGHPWLLSGPAFARQLTSVTGVHLHAR